MTDDRRQYLAGLSAQGHADADFRLVADDLSWDGVEITEVIATVHDPERWTLSVVRP